MLKTIFYNQLIESKLKTFSSPYPNKAPSTWLKKYHTAPKNDFCPQTTAAIVTAGFK